MVCAAISIGLLLVGGGIYLTWWNEANLVCTSGAYDAAAAQTNPLGTCAIDDSLFDKFVHLTCPVEESLVVSEDSTGISAPGAYKLKLQTEQYGFTKKPEKEGTGRTTCDKNGKNCKEETRTCYCLLETWTASLPVTQADFNSIQFCNKCPKSNYSAKIPQADTVWGTTPTTQLGTVEKFASHVPLGDGTLKIDGEDIPEIKNQKAIVAPTTPETISSTNVFELVGPELCNQSGNRLMCYKSITKRVNTVNATSTGINVNVIGDMRLIVTAYGSTTISALGKQSSNSDGTASIKSDEFGKSNLPPCKARDIFYAGDGSKSSSEIYTDMHDGLKVWTTVLRVVSFVMIFGGFYSIFSPIEEGAEWIPCIGELLGAIVGFILYIVCGLLSLSIWFTVFALAWVFYRPLYGAIFLLIAGALAAVVVYISRRQLENKRSKSLDTSDVPVAKAVDDYDDYP